jgi:hypothetical protein
MVNLDHSTETWGIGVGATFLALVVSSIPIISLVRGIPTFKEIVLGTVLVVLLLDTTEPVDGAAFMLIAGMVAAILFNVIKFAERLLVDIPLLFGTSSAAPPGVGGGAELTAARGAVEFVGVVVFSPIGYLVGGALGALINDNL